MGPAHVATPSLFDGVGRGRGRGGDQPIGSTASSIRRLDTWILPWHHRDPFDRLLVAQAMCENMMLVTKDRILADYPASVLW